MPVLLDTGVLVAFLHSKDRHTERAAALMTGLLSGAHGEPLSVDWVLGEGLTLIRKRIRDRTIAEHYSSLFHGAKDHMRAPLRTLPTTPDVTEEALETYFREFGRGLSFTDCVLVVQARRLGASVATFDSGFDGVVPVVAH